MDNLCRTTAKPVNGFWQAADNDLKLCGGIHNCNKGNYCRSEYE
jgi:hypothetical protein